MTSTKLTKTGIVGGILIPIFTIYILKNIWRDLWTRLFGLPIEWLGYVFLGITLTFMVGYFLRKSGNWKFNCIFVIVFCAILAFEYAYPAWFNTTWF